MAEFKVALLDDFLVDVPDDVKPLCSIISTSTEGLVTRSFKMKEVVQNSLAILNYKPPKPTVEQMKLWHPIEECATTSSRGYISLIQTQCMVMRDLALLADAASLFGSRMRKNVSFQKSIEPFNERMNVYEQTSITFSANSQMFIDRMTVVIEGMVRNLPGITGVQSALDATSEQMRVMKQLHTNWMATEKEHSLKMGTATGNYNKAKVVREMLEVAMSAERDRYQGTVKAAKDAEETRNTALKRQAEAQDKTITETSQRVVTTYHPGYKRWSWWWGWGVYGPGHTTSHVVTDVHNRVDTSARENAQRQAAAASTLQKLQDDNKHSAQAASEAAARLFAKALQDETEAKAELDSTTKLATEKVHQAQQDYLAAKATFDSGVATINAAVYATGVAQQNVVQFIKDALIVRDGALNSSTAATAMAANMTTMSALLKQNFEIDEVKTEQLSVKGVIEARAKQLIPFTDFIINELGLQNPADCVLAKEDMNDLIVEAQSFAKRQNLSWNVVMTGLLSRLATGALFQPTDAEKTALADRLGLEQVVGEKLQVISSYLTKRGTVISAQLAICVDIRTQNAHLN